MSIEDRYRVLAQCLGRPIRNTREGTILARGSCLLAFWNLVPLPPSVSPLRGCARDGEVIILPCVAGELPRRGGGGKPQAQHQAPLPLGEEGPIAKRWEVRAAQSAEPPFALRPQTPYIPRQTRWPGSRWYGGNPILEESPGSRWTGRRLTAARREPRESATESKPPEGFGPRVRVKGWGKSPPQRW